VRFEPKARSGVLFGVCRSWGYLRYGRVEKGAHRAIVEALRLGGIRDVQPRAWNGGCCVSLLLCPIAAHRVRGYSISLSPGRSIGRANKELSNGRSPAGAAPRAHRAHAATKKDPLDWEAVAHLMERELTLGTTPRAGGTLYPEPWPATAVVTRKQRGRRLGDERGSSAAG